MISTRFIDRGKGIHGVTSPEIQGDWSTDAISIQKIREQAVRLIEIIAKEVSINPRSMNKKIISYKIKSDAFFEKLKGIYKDLDEVAWVKILAFLRDTPKFQMYYNFFMDVPFQHDGGSSMYFPEAYPGDGKILVETLRPIVNLSILYPNIPGIDGRTWKQGDKIYVPADRAETLIKIKWFKKVDEN
jgi:hypothetical protein